MRPGDWIVVNGSEADLLTSDTFRVIASADLKGKIELTPNTKPGYYRLALPAVGRPVVRALTAFALGGVDPKDAITAESLAGAIAQRISTR